VSFRLGADGADAGDAPDQAQMQRPAEGEQRRPGEQRRQHRPQHRSHRAHEPEAGHQVEGEIHAEHEEFALREVDHAHDAEDQAQPQAHQAVEAADQQARGRGLQHRFEDDREVAQVTPSQPRDSMWRRARVA